MLFKINRNGRVVNEGSLQKVSKRYLPLVVEIEQKFKDVLGDSLLSIYIRGSVSTGRAIPGISDIDAVIITKSSVTSKKFNAFIKTFASNLSKKYSFVTFVDLTVIKYADLLEKAEYWGLRTNLKTQSFRLCGKEILKALPDVVPGKIFSKEMYVYYSKEIHTLEKMFQKGKVDRKYLNELHPVSFWCVWTMRVVLRSLMGPIMLYKPAFSPDLETCHDEFVELYPRFKRSINEALILAMNPTSSKKKMERFLNDFSKEYLIFWKKELNN